MERVELKHTLPLLLLPSHTLETPLGHPTRPPQSPVPPAVPLAQATPSCDHAVGGDGPSRLLHLSAGRFTLFLFSVIWDSGSFYIKCLYVPTTTATQVCVCEVIPFGFWCHVACSFCLSVRPYPSLPFHFTPFFAFPSSFPYIPTKHHLLYPILSHPCPPLLFYSSPFLLFLAFHMSQLNTISCNLLCLCPCPLLFPFIWVYLLSFKLSVPPHQWTPLPQPSDMMEPS